ncbi:MAG TPA: hypothetical protein VFV54_11635 [Thermoanaerobaculia bacterium]|nr:hypothetical protein [Thermoanaerobaculia bacterium]
MSKETSDLEAKGRRLAWIYAVALVVLVALSALRSSSVSQWLIRAGFALVMFGVSFRYAMVWIYRRKKSKLPWALAPSPTEREFEIMWLVYACFLVSAGILIALI